MWWARLLNIIAGIQSVPAPAAPYATGGTITSDATHWYHTFTSTGTFTPSLTLTCDYLIVAGGGGGGGQQGGGGGAGGLRAFTGSSFTATGYTAEIGGGGSGGTGPNNTGKASGTNTSFKSNSVTGGGYGAANGTSNNAATSLLQQCRNNAATGL